MTLDHLTRGEIDGAYRKLCASMISHSAYVLGDRMLPGGSKTTVKYRQEVRDLKAAARAWVEGGDAVLPFAEACDALDLNEDGVREGLERFARDPALTISRRWRNPGAAGRKRQAIN